MNRKERRAKGIKGLGGIYPCVITYKDSDGKTISKKFSDIDDARESAKRKKLKKYLLL
ncbi:MAG: hypothetical protein WED05_11135 [Candidatus Atabeyarchaeum deiterrae]